MAMTMRLRAIGYHGSILPPSAPSISGEMKWRTYSSITKNALCATSGGIFVAHNQGIELNEQHHIADIELGVADVADTGCATREGT